MSAEHQDLKAVSRSMGRWVGGLMLLQLFLGAATLMVLTAPLFADGGYLANVAANRPQLGVSVLLSLVGAGITLAIAVVTYPVIGRRSEREALALLLLSAVGAALTVVEQGGIVAMLLFAEAYLEAPPDVQAVFAALPRAGSALRDGTHYVGLLVHGATLGCLYLVLLRGLLLPRLLPAFGLVAVALQWYAISQPILGREVPFTLLTPLGVAQLLNGGWLLVRGFGPAEPGVNVEGGHEGR